VLVGSRPHDARLNPQVLVANAVSPGYVYMYVCSLSK
jgi:hypothetical protein